jgi:hypothetical protein
VVEAISEAFRIVTGPFKDNVDPIPSRNYRFAPLGNTHFVFSCE